MSSQQQNSAPVKVPTSSNMAAQSGAAATQALAALLSDSTMLAQIVQLLPGLAPATNVAQPLAATADSSVAPYCSAAAEPAPLPPSSTGSALWDLNLNKLHVPPPPCQPADVERAAAPRQRYAHALLLCNCVTSTKGVVLRCSRACGVCHVPFNMNSTQKVCCALHIKICPHRHPLKTTVFAGCCKAAEKRDLKKPERAAVADC